MTAADLPLLAASRRVRWFLALAAGLVLIGVFAAHHHHQHSALDGQELAFRVGASSCAASGYAITYRTDNSKHDLWNCWIKGSETCVIDENGVATDATVEARLLFANALGANKGPDCLTP